MQPKPVILNSLMLSKQQSSIISGEKPNLEVFLMKSNERFSETPIFPQKKMKEVIRDSVARKRKISSDSNFSSLKKSQSKKKDSSDSLRNNKKKKS